MKNKDAQYISIPELARLLGVSRISVFKKVKQGEIKAVKIGRNYAILRGAVDSILGRVLSEKEKNVINRAIKKTVSEYGETLKLLGKD